MYGRQDSIIRIGTGIILVKRWCINVNGNEVVNSLDSCTIVMLTRRTLFEQEIIAFHAHFP
mgnify:CR=1 FL=1